LAFNRIVVLRYRSHLESRRLAPATINLRLGAVRRLAYEAADCGLLSADLAAGIRRVKGLKKNGVRMGNWLTDEQARSFWQSPDHARMKGKRDRALLALLLACGLRRHEAANLRVEDLQQREDHWAIVDLVGKGRHIRTVPMPDWVHMELLAWLSSASINRGKIFRRVSRTGRVLGDGISEKAIWHVVRSSASKIGVPALAPHDLRRTCARLCRNARAVNWIRSSFCSAMSRFRPRSSTSVLGSVSGRQSMIGLGLSPARMKLVIPRKAFSRRKRV
jgi:integrase